MEKETTFWEDIENWRRKRNKFMKEKIKRKKDIIDNNQFEFNLLSDQPIPADKKKDDRFDYQKIAQTIFNLIEKTNPPFTLGLYGKWGVGKTTIVGFVEDMARKNEYATFFFDVWKYERDSLRRQFLIRLDEELELGLRFKETLNQSLTRVTQPSLKELAKTVFKNLLLRLIFLITFILIVAWVISFFIKIPDLLLDYHQLLSALVGLGILGSFVSFILSSFQILHGSIQEYRTDSAEGFEDKFNEALTKIKKEKLLIVVDNLDRLEHRKAVDVLSDIKTFLTKEREESKTIFLIPCDDEALSVHLHSVYGDTFDADEFLRKFFNLTFKIPKFIDLELDNYIKELLLQTKIQEFSKNRDLESVIIYAFRDNPREIKQFINSLISSFLLAKRQGLDLIINNLAFLAKLITIRQKFPRIYRILEEKTLRTLLSFKNPNLIEILKGELEKLFIIEGVGIDLQTIEKKVDYEIDRFKAFHVPTTGIFVEETDLFFTLRQSVEEKQISEWTSYILAVEEKRIKDAKLIFNDVRARNLIQLLDSRLRDYIKKRKEGVKLINLFSSSIKVFYDVNELMPQFFDELARYFPDSGTLFNNLNDFDPEIIFNFVFPNTASSLRGNFVDSFIGLLGMAKDNSTSSLPEDYVLKFLNIIVHKKHYFIKHREQIKEGIENYFYTERFLSILIDKKLEAEFITDKAKEKFIDSINIDHYSDDEEETKDQLEKVLECWNKLTLSKDTIIVSIKKYTELLGSTSAGDWRRDILVESLDKFIKKYGNLIKEKDMNELINSLSDLMLKIYDQSSAEKKVEAVRTIDFLASIEGNKHINDLGAKIKDFIKISSDDVLGNKISQETLIRWIKSYPETILERGKINPSWLIKKKLSSHLSEDQNNQIIEELINRISDREELITSEELDIFKELNMKEHIGSQDKLFGYVTKTMSEGRSEKRKVRKVVENHRDLFTPEQWKKISPKKYTKRKRKLKE